MQPLRRLVASHRVVAGAILALALVMKLLIPAGFMPTVANGQMVVRMCSGTGPMTMVMAIPGFEDKADREGDHDKHAQPCAFSGLSTPSLAAADPILLALAILFVLAMGVRALAAPTTSAPPYLRPPLRGPPAH
ncbi:hypothetical protein [Sphingomonas elodea]|uniref:hypothetical protein n=1 Tax=Sphingomonas elodea TaxID=179878 RepID=UPI000263027D|nr:hypothetical protein [Sphingomonas elodea]